MRACGISQNYLRKRLHALKSYLIALIGSVALEFGFEEFPSEFHRFK